jgi:hypothetical protein
VCAESIRRACVHREGEVVVVKLPARSSSSGVTALAVITKAAEHEYDVSVGAAGRVAGLTAAKLGKIHWQVRPPQAAHLHFSPCGSPCSFSIVLALIGARHDRREPNWRLPHLRKLQAAMYQ